MPPFHAPFLGLGRSHATLWLKLADASVGLRAGETSPLGEISSYANLPIGPRSGPRRVGAKLGLRNGDKGAGAGGSIAERWVMFTGKLLKFMEEAKILEKPLISPLLPTKDAVTTVNFRGETVEMVVTTSPVSVSISLMKGSVGLISTVICAFSYHLKKEPFMVYMVRFEGGSAITAHFIDESVDPEVARFTVFLAEILTGTEITAEINFEEVRKEAERFLSEHF
jgi:hypothetical protein